ncbi:ParB N-terminal domain-containing protein [Kaistia dalseonensis]|uniref:ParB family chromosome partitioning protein n=1 Tax=Kaistia dalseonensis TaxID=410840 RepID=A0ABU0HC84_9HYPH|nr:ParB N-terminal domain-containing protein [Kaistia dalseonensis]MCX5497288.1 ParB N-terminal domain-containing protein [Kaistia dalseonensis]MDQ0439924.1 ParB family chromosome partitioning protein [Kaistia dalseonensis]
MSDVSKAPIRIQLADIDISQRLRPVDEAKALFIAAGMAKGGLETPIEVRPAPKKAKKPYILIVGGHRCRAAFELGWTEIDAFVLDISADEARMREIDENLYRAELTELDRAVFLAAKKELYEKLNPSTKHGGDRVSEQVAIFGDLAPRFTAEVTERLGYSERTIQRVVARAAIPASIRARIAGTRLANTGAELDALLRLSPDEQAKALDLLLSGEEGAPRSVAAAHAALTGARAAQVAPSDAEFDGLLKAWRRAGQSARARFIADLQRQGAITAATEGDDQ